MPKAETDTRVITVLSARPVAAHKKTEAMQSDGLG